MSAPTFVFHVLIASFRLPLRFSQCLPRYQHVPFFGIETLTGIKKTMRHLVLGVLKLTASIDRDFNELGSIRTVQFEYKLPQVRFSTRVPQHPASLRNN